MRNAVKHKDLWLCKGSTAYELYEAKNWSKLEAHMKQGPEGSLDKNERELLAHYSKGETK